jgi:hypothetical protein
MADKKISALTSATTPLAGTEVLPIVQSGATVKVPVSDLTAGRAVSGLSFTDSNGKIRAVPQSGAAKVASYTLVVGDVGEYIEIGTSGSITIPNATFATGDIVSLFNNTAGNITVTCTITTAYISGTNTDRATVTLATRGLATILFISGTVCVINGNVT